MLWDRTVINMDGSVTPCCQLYLPTHAFAGRFDAAFANIWNGPQYVAARRTFLDGPGAARGRGPRLRPLHGTGECPVRRIAPEG